MTNLSQGWGKLERTGGSESDPAILAPDLLIFGSSNSASINQMEEIFFGRTNPSKSELHSRGFTHSSQVVIPVPYASATHFKICRDHVGTIVLTDLSRNGTVVNGEVIGNNKPVILSTGSKVGLKFKNDIKVEYTFYVLPTISKDSNPLGGSHGSVGSAVDSSFPPLHPVPAGATRIVQTSQPSQWDPVLLEQLRQYENKCRTMVEEQAVLTAQVGLLEARLEEESAGRLAERQSSAIEREKASQERMRLVEEYRVQLLDATSAVAAASAGCTDLATKLEIAQRSSAEHAAKAKASAAQITKLEEQLQAQAAMLQGTRESYMTGQVKNTAVIARLEEMEATITRLELANASLQDTLDAREHEWTSGVATATRCMQTYEMKLRNALLVISGGLVPSLDSILQQLEQTISISTSDLDQMGAAVFGPLGNSNGAVVGTKSHLSQANASSPIRALAADTLTLTQASQALLFDQRHNSQAGLDSSQGVENSGKPISQTNVHRLKREVEDDADNDDGKGKNMDHRHQSQCVISQELGSSGIQSPSKRQKYT